MCGGSCRQPTAAPGQQSCRFTLSGACRGLWKTWELKDSRLTALSDLL